MTLRSIVNNWQTNYNASNNSLNAATARCYHTQPLSDPTTWWNRRPGCVILYTLPRVSRWRHLSAHRAGSLRYYSRLSGRFPTSSGAAHDPCWGYSVASDEGRCGGSLLPFLHLNYYRLLRPCRKKAEPCHCCGGVYRSGFAQLCSSSVSIAKQKDAPSVLARQSHERMVQPKRSSLYHVHSPPLTTTFCRSPCCPYPPQRSRGRRVFGCCA